MPNIRVSDAVMTGVADNIKSKSNSIRSRLDAMDSELRQLATNWNGQAQNAYGVAKANWSRDIDDMNTVLNEIGQLVLEHNSNMGASDRRGSARFSAY